MFDIFTKDGFIQMLYFLPGLLISLSIHEFGHAYVAYKLGDKRQKTLGRLTITPFAHIDWLGFLSILMFGFGWGKPVMVDDSNFENKNRDNMLVALSGPVFNILLAFTITIILKILILFNVSNALFNLRMGQTVLSIIMQTISFNIIFAVFNLIPLPPFDGSKVLRFFLPFKVRQLFDKLERYSFLILIILLVSDVYLYIIMPAYSLLGNCINWILNI